jgi:hypothetical protein
MIIFANHRNTLIIDETKMSFEMLWVHIGQHVACSSQKSVKDSRSQEWQG